jgi:hypothetical protein
MIHLSAANDRENIRFLVYVRMHSGSGDSTYLEHNIS